MEGGVALENVAGRQVFKVKRPEMQIVHISRYGTAWDWWGVYYLWSTEGIAGNYEPHVPVYPSVEMKYGHNIPQENALLAS
jgi:hypothetical protein